MFEYFAIEHSNLNLRLWLSPNTDRYTHPYIRAHTSVVPRTALISLLEQYSAFLKTETGTRTNFAFLKTRLREIYQVLEILELVITIQFLSLS